ncbi:hypothetical protein [Tuwongella immobilis]|uniref:Gfo/Idh/MocA-like oxidoreductase N-terminal domain-containing protein n=1 Tax=Tuwongella immobilis TaxID=692036 RepID=A0A6C2YHN5_9BACT|nr:hypothetical protein [Tuwongella immobilis]VIP00874.1 Uncharacterized protein OS=Singulisphaera acidiphila (strain ATCC BAA-1392 / DSM 18658 / VKM B-2454 / MOB10) GN=Sinac_1553 PE=4 SV=1 [Tuwongella immobilis]VTR97166.1 Uncharacterized protein OS=Singulisphaera acidiphila (strain ATCC BAA-1392 / DSM 18658 / VKM B-2454 / MOB10) GN=Sinac_1553 PE=4 SV=1 [Tuwongella immobilis]
MNRRHFLQATAGSLLLPATLIPAPMLAADPPRLFPPKRTKPATRKVAVIASTYYYLSHAYHICGRLLDGYFKGKAYHFPEIGIASMWVEQISANNLSKSVCHDYGIRDCANIEEALTLGTGKLAVDGVLLICEHGDYPTNAKGQKLYPRYEMFQKIVQVFEKVGKSVPVFCDKHLSYDRKRGFEMVATAKKMGFGLFAGSSLPVTWREPELELPVGVPLEEAVVVTRGDREIFGIHGLEALQCMVERRKPGQQGVRSVQAIEGDAVWKAGMDGRFSLELVEHAIGRSPSRNVGDIRTNTKQYRPLIHNSYDKQLPEEGPLAFCIEYRDGLKATLLFANGHVDDTTFAGRVKGQKTIPSTHFFLPPPPGAAFLEALTSHVETFILTGKPPYPVERTLLTGGILDWALESRVQGGKKLETTDLDVQYDPPADSGFMRGSYANPVQ